MNSYKVAMDTAAAALAKLSAAGLSRGEPGRGTFAVDLDRARPMPVLEVMAAASLCRQVAAASFPPGAVPTVGVGGDPEWNTEHAHETHELGLEPEAYDPHLDVDFSPLRGDGPGADGYGQAA